MAGVGNDQQRSGAAAARRERLAVQRGLTHRSRAVQPAVAQRFLRFVGENENRLAFDIEARVVVVARRRRRQAVARKHHGHTLQINRRLLGAVGRRGGQRVVRLAKRETDRFSAGANDEGIALIDVQACGQPERLKPSAVLPARSQAGRLELSSDVVGRTFEPVGSVTPPLQFIGGQELDVLEDRLRRDRRRRGADDACGE